MEPAIQQPLPPEVSEDALPGLVARHGALTSPGHCTGIRPPTAPARTSTTKWDALTARHHPVCADIQFTVQRDAEAHDHRNDAGAAPDDAHRNDAGLPDPDAAADHPPQAPAPSEPQRTEVPDPIVGAWQAGAIDFALWENYREGYYAGRNAVPSREAMVFSKNGDAKFYRYEFAFNFYEELIDCEGSVAFHGDGTFTFYPVSGRKRFYDSRHSEQNVDRALTVAELTDPELAGKRAYAIVGSSEPATLQITVPSSAPYNWYRKE